MSKKIEIKVGKEFLWMDFDQLVAHEHWMAYRQAELVPQLLIDFIGRHRAQYPDCKLCKDLDAEKGYKV